VEQPSAGDLLRMEVLVPAWTLQVSPLSSTHAVLSQRRTKAVEVPSARETFILDLVCCHGAEEW
jgi:hypothetical protein